MSFDDYLHESIDDYLYQFMDDYANYNGIYIEEPYNSLINLLPDYLKTSLNRILTFPYYSSWDASRYRKSKIRSTITLIKSFLENLDTILHINTEYLILVYENHNDQFPITSDEKGFHNLLVDRYIQLQELLDNLESRIGINNPTRYAAAAAAFGSYIR